MSRKSFFFFFKQRNSKHYLTLLRTFQTHQFPIGTCTNWDIQAESRKTRLQINLWSFKMELCKLFPHLFQYHQREQALWLAASLLVGGICRPWGVRNPSIGPGWRNRPGAVASRCVASGNHGDCLQNRGSRTRAPVQTPEWHTSQMRWKCNIDKCFY